MDLSAPTEEMDSIPGPPTDPMPGRSTDPMPGRSTNPIPGPSTNPMPGPSTNPMPGRSTNPVSGRPVDPIRGPSMVEVSPPELPTVAPPDAGGRCVGCGAALASDQRYCVECGQRLGRARLPFMEDPARHATQSTAPQAGKLRMSVNSTLIAGVGTLMLAMGIGILIGRSSPGSSGKSAGAVQVLTVPGSGAAGTAAATPEAGSTTTGGSAGASTSAKSGKGSAKSASKPHLPPPKVVTVGSPGKGPGYQKGHFTGNFFGEGEK